METLAVTFQLYQRAVRAGCMRLKERDAPSESFQQYRVVVKTGWRDALSELEIKV